MPDKKLELEEIFSKLKLDNLNLGDLAEKMKVEMPDLKQNLKRMEKELTAIRPQIPEFDESEFEKIDKFNEERIQRENDMVKALKIVADVQPKIIGNLIVLAEESEKTSKRQHRLNICLIILAALTLLSSIIFGLMNLQIISF